MNHLTPEQLFDLTEGNLPPQEAGALQQHLASCGLCQEQYQLYIALEDDLRSLEAPEVSPGFALNVTRKLRDRETARIFHRPVFKVFQFALVLSFILAVGIIITQLSSHQIDLPEIVVPGGTYYVIAVACVAIIAVADRVIYGSAKKNL
ncbi:MAG: hypothetical protein RIC80_15080 [Cyclobacteriaceae bacterium]